MEIKSIYVGNKQVVLLMKKRGFTQESEFFNYPHPMPCSGQLGGSVIPVGMEGMVGSDPTRPYFNGFTKLVL